MKCELDNAHAQADFRNKPDRNQNREPNRTYTKARDLQDKKPRPES